MWYQKPLLGSQVNWEYPLAKGLVVYWLMSEGSGNKIFDLSGNGNHGTLNGPSWVTDRVGPTLDFGDTADEYKVESSLSNISGTVSTLSLWAKIRTFIPNGPVFFGTSTTNSVYWQLWTAGANDNVLIHSQDIGDCDIDTYNDSIWRHYVFVSDGSNGIFYVNGVLRKLAVIAPTSIVAGAKNWELGRWMSGNDWTHDGLIDNLLFYDRALADFEVEQLYREPHALLYQPSRAKYYFVSAAAGPTAKAVAGSLTVSGALTRKVTFKRAVAGAI